MERRQPGTRHMRVVLQTQSFRLSGLALDVISKCAFSMDTDAMKNPDDELLKNGRDVFADFIPTNWLETLAFMIPTAYLPVILNYVPLLNDAQKWMFKLTTNIMKVAD